MSAKPDLTVHISPKQLGALAKGIKLTEIREAMPQLEALCNRKIEIGDEFSDLCRLVAIKAGIEPSVLSIYINAVCRDTLQKTEAKAGQLSLLFEELGT